MAAPRRAVALILLLSSVALAGCFSEDLSDTAAPERADWRVGDRWTYARSHDGGPEFLYVREVVGLYNLKGHEVFEVRQGIEGHPVHQLARYTVGKLGFMGFEVREGGEARQSLVPDGPVPFHYVFPLTPGSEQVSEARLRQTVTDHTQEDHIRTTATVGAPERLTLDERVYTVFPYAVRIEFLDTPFPDDDARIVGHWSPQVGQSVLTEVHQGGAVTEYRLVAFERDRPVDGPPAYDLVKGLETFRLARGFTATLDEAGHARWLFHVDTPTRVTMRYDPPATESELGHADYDMVSLRPLGATGAWLARNSDALDRTGVVSHMAATTEVGSRFVFHTGTDTEGRATVRLLPGQVYELVVASDDPGLRVEIVHGDETQARAPVETGRVVPIAVAHERVTHTTRPGPQQIRDDVTVHLSLADDERFEGLVFASNHDDGSAALGEVGASRSVSVTDQGFGVHDDEGAYALFLDHGAREALELRTSFEYRADAAVRGSVDYELGVFLLKFLPE